ncbi:MAG: glycosyltransferase family 4 protein [Actinomycetota bacterium]|nr:glycosyltransferase family 4 protein [Actinomycetota bacterium]MDA3019896.1 glycosyltransferase family 4 protein [Actinomycetota bacterium]
MRILLVTWEFPPETIGGVGAHVDGLSKSLAKDGHDVCIFTLSAPGIVEDQVVAGVRIIRADVDLPWFPEDDAVGFVSSGNHHITALLAQLDDWRPDVVHAHDWRSAWAGHTLATLCAVPLVTTFHSTESGRHGGNVPEGDPASIHSVESWIANVSQRVICCSRFMQREVIDGFELIPDQVHLIPNGVDVDEWAPDGVQQRNMLVLAWGRVQYEKGFQVLAQAIGRLRSRVPEIRCVIAGRGPYLPELQSQVDIEGVSDLVHLAGYITDEELRSLLHEAGCVVIPSLYEPFGIVALESLAANAPTIVARTGGLAEIMEGTEAGLMFEPGNAKELATRIERVLMNPHVLQNMQAQGAEILHARFSWDAIARSTVIAYETARAGL